MSSEEVILFGGLGPLEYAEQIWRSLTGNAIMTPLQGLVSEEELNHKIKPEYLAQAVEMATEWVTKEGVANPYTMLWVKATK